MHIFAKVCTWFVHTTMYACVSVCACFMNEESIKYLPVTYELIFYIHLHTHPYMHTYSSTHIHTHQAKPTCTCVPVYTQRNTPRVFSMAATFLIFQVSPKGIYVYTGILLLVVLLPCCRHFPVYRYTARHWLVVINTYLTA